MALTTSLPQKQDRGAFMSINSSLQQIAGGIAAAVGGLIVVQKTKYSPLEHYNTLGLVIIVLSVISIFLVYRMSEVVKRRVAATQTASEDQDVSNTVFTAPEDVYEGGERLEALP